MAAYAPPVNTLVKLGRPGYGEWADYSTYGIGPEHVPELIRLLQDEELAWADSELPDVYGQVHAWRALGQLRAETAIEPLLDLLAEQEDEEKWNDWTTEEVPRVLGMIGPVALSAVTARLEQRGDQEWVPVYYAGALTEIAKRHPATRDEVIQRLSHVLESADVNDAGLNGSVIADLLELRAREAWPVIERAFATGNVDTFAAGDAAHVKWELGLGPQPTLPPRPASGWLQAGRPDTGLSGRRTPKERAAERARLRKAEKRKRKKRKRK